MVKAIWNGKVLAESDRTILVEGNHYFPPDSIKQEYFQDSTTHTICSWKGQASCHANKRLYCILARCESRPGIAIPARTRSEYRDKYE
jgi:hypothetical protein